MARKIEALVLRNICTESNGVIRKGETAQLTGKEMEHYVSLGAVQRPAFVAQEAEVELEIVEESTEYNEIIEGGDA